MTTQVEHLVKMAEQIALNFSAWGDEQVVAGKIGEHLEKFWTPAMQRQLIEYGQSRERELSPAVQRALIVLGQQLERGETTT